MKRFEVNGLIKSILLYMVSALGISLTIKASIGVSSFNAMNVALSAAVGVQVGTVTTLLNVAFLLVYMYLTGFKQWSKYLLQLGFVLMLGSLINLFTYGLLMDWQIGSYLGRLLVIVLGIVLGGASVGMIVNYNAITFPIEAVCDALSQRTRFSFTQLRYGVDLLSIAISLGTSLLLQLPLFVREGTLLSLLLFTLTMSHVKHLHKTLIDPQPRGLKNHLTG